MIKDFYYKIIVSIAFLLFEFLSISQTEFFVDSRDTKEYKIIKIGDQIWFTENLNYDTEGSWWYNDKKSIGKRHGRLYTWDAAMDACPEGWHLPSDKEWTELIAFYGGEKKAGMELKIEGTSGFNARYSGFRDSEKDVFYDFGNDANFWTSTSLGEKVAWRCYIDRGYDDIVQDYYGKEGGLSVRCKKD